MLQATNILFLSQKTLIITMDEFDYIIIGAGSAGCVLTNRLIKSGKYKSCTYGTTNCPLSCSLVFSLASGQSCLLKSLGASRPSYRTGSASCLHGKQYCFTQLRGRSFSPSLATSLKKQNGVIDC